MGSRDKPMKTNLWPMVTILIITYAVSFITSPADPISFYIEWFIMAAIGIGSYWTGVAKGRKQTAIS